MSTEPDDLDTAGTFTVDAAFIVYVKDGVATATSALREVILEVEGKPALLDAQGVADFDVMLRAVDEVERDISMQRVAQLTANFVLQGQMQLAQRMQQQAEAQAIAKQTGLTVPGR